MPEDKVLSCLFLPRHCELCGFPDSNSIRSIGRRFRCIQTESEVSVLQGSVKWTAISRVGARSPSAASTTLAQVCISPFLAPFLAPTGGCAQSGPIIRVIWQHDAGCHQVVCFERHDAIATSSLANVNSSLGLWDKVGESLAGSGTEGKKGRERHLYALFCRIKG